MPGIRSFVRIGSYVVLVASVLFLGAVATQAATNFIHIATATNVTENYTKIDNANTNGNPSARLLVTMNLSPYGVPAVVDNHPIGVRYDPGFLKWAIYNEDVADMPVGAAFNVRILDTAATSNILQVAASSNIVSTWTVITNSLTNNNKTAIVFTTHNWNPSGGTTGTYDNHTTGVWYYNGTNWAVYNERISGADNTLPVGAAFNTEMFSSTGGNVFLHLSTNSSSPGAAPSFKPHYTIIDNPLTNGNPKAILFVEHNWSPASGGTQGTYTYITSPVAVNYLPAELKWAIVLTDSEKNLPVGAAFNVMVTSGPLR
jgi:hypothetical protein